jgi:hypothetical protein
MAALTLTALTGAGSETSRANNDDKRIEIESRSGIRGGTSAVAKSEILLSHYEAPGGRCALCRHSTWIGPSYRGERMGFTWRRHS